MVAEDAVCERAEEDLVGKRTLPQAEDEESDDKREQAFGQEHGLAVAGQQHAARPVSSASDGKRRGRRASGDDGQQGRRLRRQTRIGWDANRAGTRSGGTRLNVDVAGYEGGPAVEEGRARAKIMYSDMWGPRMATWTHMGTWTWTWGHGHYVCDVCVSCQHG